MANKLCSDEDFIQAWHAAEGSPNKVAEILQLDVRGIYMRRNKLKEKGFNLETKRGVGRPTKYHTDVARAYPRERRAEISDGSIVVFSDAHFWPQEMTAANAALLEIIKELKPKRVIANGDIFDGARISRHSPLGWADTPTVKEEMEVCQERMHEILMASNPKKSGCAFDWNIGNHDQRFDKFLVANVSDYTGVLPRLQDKFPQWDMAWSLRLNDNIMVKHRWHNGIHATYNNTLKSGLNIVTGHLHRLAVTPWTDYNGRRYGVDTGTLATSDMPQFDYAENNPAPWCSGFVVLTFKDGRLLPPELVEVHNDVAYFRGQVVHDGRKQED